MREKETYNDFESLCAGYVLDALTDEERAEFEELLKHASNKQLELYHDMKASRDEMALAVEPAEPRNDLFDDILDEISEQPPRQASVIPLWVFKAAAAVLLIGVLGLAVYNLQLTNQVEEQTAVITELQSELEQKEELLAILESREVNLILMAGLDVNPDGYGKIIWDPENDRALLQVANLPRPPEDKDYQLWLIKDDQSPISAGVFSFAQPSTDLFFKIDQLNQDPSELSNTFAVTMEPKGGVPQPTGDMYLAGQQN
jgi:anti-sigma-K factor RskA